MLKWFLPTLVAVLAGILVLLGTFVPVPTLGALRTVLVRWAAVVAAFALVLAYWNLLRVHAGRLFRKGEKRRFSSLILLVAALGSLIVVLIQGPNSALAQGWIQTVLVPGQSALLAVTAVTLALAGMRAFGTRRRVESVLFVAVAVIMLLTTVPLVYPVFVEHVLQFVEAAGTGGMRGLLLGVTLGIVMTGLRVVLGIDRPHSGG